MGHINKHTSVEIVITTESQGVICGSFVENTTAGGSIRQLSNHWATAPLPGPEVIHASSHMCVLF